MTETLGFLFFLLSPMCVILSSGDNTTLTAVASQPPSTLSISGSISSTASSEPESALLTHVLYDSHANLRHHHHNHPWGPHFEENPINVTVDEGGSTRLDCIVGLIEDKLVSWVRRKSDRLDVLTLGTTNHSSDPRISSDFKYPNNWRLAIRNATRNDSGTYLCQISTHPPKVLEVQLTVQAPEVFIVNTRGERISEVHYKEGSTLQLICSVNNVFKSKIVNWFRNKDLLNHDVVRGGVSIKTDMTGDQAKSILRVAWVTRKDGGTYLCSAPPFNATITVHVLNGENPAELYHNGDGGRTRTSSSWTSALVIIFVLLWVSGSQV